MITYKLEAEMELVGRHIRVLKEVMNDQPVGIIKLSQKLELPEHKIRYSLRILEQEGLIEPSPGGAKTTRKAKKMLRNLKEVLKRIEEEARQLQNEIDEIINS